MIPAYPLDGGRVFRAIAWALTGNAVRATKIAAGVGQFVATIFIVLGLFRFFGGAGFGGLWLAFIGWFLSQAAKASTSETDASTVLSVIRVGDIMGEDCLRVDGYLDLRTFADDYVLRTGRRCFLVTENGIESGLVTIHELTQVPRARWPFTTVSQIARAFESLRTVSPDTSVKEALDLMVHNDVNQLPVVSGDRLLGVVSRGNILQYLKTRGELKAA
jgi:signal-transduction protein with cAMP-binding, CBS, and nucleotidyltransferase domain